MNGKSDRSDRQNLQKSKRPIFVSDTSFLLATQWLVGVSAQASTADAPPSVARQPVMISFPARDASQKAEHGLVASRSDRPLPVRVRLRRKATSCEACMRSSLAERRCACVAQFSCCTAQFARY